MTEIAESQTKKTVKKISPAVWLAGLAVLSASVALLAVFVLAGWAEASAVGHGIQHVVIFLAGLGLGGSTLALYQNQMKGSRK